MKTINVFVRDVPAPLDIAYNDMAGRYPVQATLIQWDGPPQRVFSEDQVKAMVEDIKVIAAENAAKAYTNRIEQMTPPAPVAFHIDNYLWKTHGITL